MLIRSMYHIRFSEFPRTEISLFKSVYIAFQSEDVKGCFYDFIFCTRNEDGTYSWKRAFHTNDPFSPLDERAADLYAQISKKLDAVRIAPDIRSIVQAYLH